jgi:hypothetical protein
MTGLGANPARSPYMPLMEDDLTPEEADQRATETLRRMLTTPPKPKPAKASAGDDAKPKKRGRPVSAS